ncbi:MAG: flavin reductase family protein [Candidatus Zhuqueibacterota bacterium]
MISIAPKDLKIHPVDLWLNQWLLLTVGDRHAFNTMTVAWGSIGGMWQKPFVQVVVRPTRHTFKFIEKYSTFTLCAFSESHRKALAYLGTKSGRDGNKIQESGLTIIDSHAVDAPSFKEAELILECKKIYWQDMNPHNFIDTAIHRNYPAKDYHRIYFGEIVYVLADDSFKNSPE